MPSGASPIEAFISIRLKEPLRREPHIATTLGIACPVGWFGLKSGRRPGIAPGRRAFLAREMRPWRATLFDHPIGGEEQLRWDFQPKCGRGLAVDGKLELVGALNRQIARLGALEDAIDVQGRLAKLSD